MSSAQSGSNETPERRNAVRGGVGKLLSLCNNPMSLIGLLVIGLATMGLIGFFMFMLTSTQGNPYLDIVGYMILPGMLVFGLIIVPIGIIWKWRWLLKHPGEHVPRRVEIDLNDGPTRGAAIIFLVITLFVVVPAVAVSAYEGYHYTESTEFCAEVCHEVMEPQGVAHAGSAHARVSCAECHIGTGADWFVKSKLSGTRQVLAVWRDSFSRPIPPAITELRPARDTCEACHWPERFFGSQLKEVVHFSPNEENTRHVVRMLLKTGGADESIGRVEGIHMHMLVSGGIEYVALDEHLQEIPWVRYERPDGSVSIYRSDGLPSDAPPPDGFRRMVDCMDCHNRGAHHFLPPQAAVNLQLEAGRIADDLPYIKREAVRALVGEYDDLPTAMAGIQQQLAAFYHAEFPDVWQTRRADVEQAIKTTQQAYKRNFFPRMNVSWTTYPENVGHMISPGCIRCHDGLHIDELGEPIQSDCVVCHTFLNQIPGEPDRFREGKFEHSMSLAGHEQLRCSQCHGGGPLPLCRDCHNDMRGLEGWTDEGRFRKTGD